MCDDHVRVEKQENTTQQEHLFRSIPDGDKSKGEKDPWQHTRSGVLFICMYNFVFFFFFLSITNQTWNSSVAEGILNSRYVIRNITNNYYSLTNESQSKFRLSFVKISRFKISFCEFSSYRHDRDSHQRFFDYINRR